MNYKKILVIGASGSGKSTVAKRIAKALGITYVPTDPFYWGKDWKTVSDESVRERVMEVLKQPDWVMDGNFDSIRETVWPEADCILWLNYPLPTVFYRVIIRNLWWWVTQEEVWSGNRMSFKHAINGIWHAMRSYGKKKRNYPMWLNEVEFSKVKIFRSNPRANGWLRRKSKQRFFDLVLKENLDKLRWGKMTFNEFAVIYSDEITTNFSHAPIFRAVTKYEFDESIVLNISEIHIKNILEMFLEDKITVKELSDWAAFIEMSPNFYPEGENEEEIDSAGERVMWTYMTDLVLGQISKPKAMKIIEEISADIPDEA